MQRQREEYEKATKDIQNPIKLKKRKQEIFQYPEDIPDIAALFTHLNKEQMPRKFRKIALTNPEGFGNTKIVKEAAFEKLERYSEFAFSEATKRGQKVTTYNSLSG